MVTLAFTVVFVLLVVTGVGHAIHWDIRSLRAPNPLREEIREKIRARPETFRAEVERRDWRGPVSLSVHGDVFEVAQKLPVIGFLNCYRAQDSTVETVSGWLHDWIEICGRPGTGAEPIQIGHRRTNRLLWDVLVSAGAHPIGPPPQSR